MTDKVLEFKKENVFSIEEVVKRDYGKGDFVFACYYPNGDLRTFISSDIKDKDLVYIIKTLDDRRHREFNDMNE